MDMLGALRAFDLTVVESPGWRTNDRPGSFAPIGVVEHHTASPKTSGPAASLSVVRNGRGGIPGPLCNLLIERGLSPRVHLISDGRASDTGRGVERVLEEVRANTPPTRTAAQRGLDDDIDGNPWFYDIEWELDGRGEEPTPEMYDIGIRATAALLAWEGWDERRVISHAMWSRRKIDPSDIDMLQLRADVAAALKGDTVTQAQMDELKAYVKQAVRVQVAAILYGSNAKDNGAWLRDDAEPWTSPLPNLRALANQLAAIDARIGAGDGNVDVDAVAEAVADKIAARLAS